MNKKRNYKRPRTRLLGVTVEKSLLQASITHYDSFSNEPIITVDPWDDENNGPHETINDWGGFYYE